MKRTLKTISELAQRTIHRVEEHVRKELEKANVRSIVVGVSGGADSVALLTALNSLEDSGFIIIPVHCNFHLRGEESNRDSEFVRQLCKQLNLKLTEADFDVEAYKKKHKVSTEVACRELRYGLFKNILKERGYDRIAVAHNSDDQAETVLLNLMRGSGVSGLRAMLPDTGEIIRPLLTVSRSEILDYLKSKGQEYVTDSTNLECAYRRNFLRNEVIPMLEKRWPQVKKSICRTAEIMRQEEKIIGSCAEVLVSSDSQQLYYEKLTYVHDPLWLLYKFGRRFGATESQCREMLRTVNARPFQSGKTWHTAEGRFVAERDHLDFIPNHIIRDISVKIKSLSSSEFTVSEVMSAPLTELWTTAQPENVIMRHARQGDKIKPLGIKGTSTVSKVLKDAKLTTRQKEDVVVAENKETGRIIWIEGIKRSSEHLVSSETKKVYRYTIDHKMDITDE